MGNATVLRKRAEEPRRSHTVAIALAMGAATLLALMGYYVGFLGTVDRIVMPGTFQAFGLLTLAVAIGTAAFFSPCAFPLLPAYAAYALEAQQGQPRSLRKALKLGLAAGAGLSVVVLAVGGAIAALGAAAPFQPDPRDDPWWLLGIRAAAGLAIAVFGLLTLLGRTGLLSRFFHALQPKAQGKGPVGTPARGMFLFGFAYSGAGVGCTGPLLLAFMLYAFTLADPLLAVLGFAVFAATMASLMVLVTGLVGMARGASVQRLRAAAPRIQRIGGAVTLSVGIWTVLSVTVATDLFVRVFFPFLPP